jgi:hypothetical protein
MFNYNAKKKNIYGKATETFLFIHVKAWKQQHGEKSKWLNAQNAVQK